VAEQGGGLGLRSGVLEANGARVYYEQSGPDGAADVLLLHGWGCTSQLWKPVTDRLARLMRVTALDFPGHGKSGRPPQPWGAGEFAEMARQVIAQLGLGKPAIIGHSHGGRVALRLAVDHPAFVGKLVLAGSAGLRGKPTLKKRARSLAYKALRGTLDVLDKTRRFGDWPEQTRTKLRSAFGSADYKALDDEMRKTFVRLVNTDLTDELPRVQSPTLLIWGDKDDATPLWMGRAMEKAIPDAGLVVLEGGTHFAYLEQAARFCAIVEHFLLSR